MNIYRVTNNISGRQYIGRTTEAVRKRWRRHCREAVRGLHPQVALHGAIRKYGADTFFVETLETRDAVDALLSAERRCIKEHLDRGVRLYNMTEGGDGSLGLKHSSRARAKIQEKALARYRLAGARHPCAKPCVIDGVRYPSLANAERSLDVSHNIAWRWAQTGVGRRRGQRSDRRHGWRPQHTVSLIAT